LREAVVLVSSGVEEQGAIHHPSQGVMGDAREWWGSVEREGKALEAIGIDELALRLVGRSWDWSGKVHVSIEGGGGEHRDHWCGGMELLEA